MRGTYIGSIEHLKGKTSLLRKMPEEGFVAAQFDDIQLTRSGVRLPKLTWRDKPPDDALGYGWHLFRAMDFEITSTGENL